MIAIVGGNVYTGRGKLIPRGTVLVEGERIVAVGQGITIPRDAQVKDVSGMTVFPGMIDAHCHVGLFEEGLGWEGDDVNEITDPITPQLRAVDGINPEDVGLKEAARAGVTAVWSAPGSANIIGGQGVALHTVGRFVEDMVLREPCGLKAALGENPKRCYGLELKKSPSTRMGSAATLRETLVKAQNYARKKKHAEEKGEPVEIDFKLEPIVKLLKGELTLRLHAHRADDIMTGIRIAREFGFPICIDHCTEGHKVADVLARERIPAVIGPSLTGRVKVELRELDFATVAACASAGVKVAIATDHPVVPSKYLPLCVGLAIKAGLSWDYALQAVTLNAAEIIGIDDQVGTIEAGKLADICVAQGDPFSIEGKMVAVMVKGQWL
ncbi:MAG TPA: amidohydrolase [Firmicutes bacterium]|nr:amidohydrolase [Bacillota bacterium]